MTCRTVASPVLHCKCCTYLIYTNTNKLKAMYHTCIQMASTPQTTKTQCTITKDIYCIDESLSTHIHSSVMWSNACGYKGKAPHALAQMA